MAYKRNIFLINPKFQLKFSLFVTLMVVVLTSVYPFVIFHMVEKFIEMSPENQAGFASVREGLIIVLTIFQVLFAFGVFLGFIYLTHRIAGPMYKLQSFLKNIADGNPPERLFFRKGDYFQEIPEHFNDAFNKVSQRHHNDSKYINEIMAYINNLALVVPEDKKPVLQEIIGRLQETKDRFEVEM